MSTYVDHWEEPLPVLIGYKPRASTKRIILHESHTAWPAVPSAAAHLRVTGRQNGLLEIGYHAVIEADGTVVRTRKWQSLGSHAPGCNHDSIGICLAGDEHNTNWVYGRVVQFASLELVYGDLELHYGNLPVLGHDEVIRRRDRTHKCPSFDMDWVRNLLGAPIRHAKHEA